MQILSSLNILGKLQDIYMVNPYVGYMCVCLVHPTSQRNWIWYGIQMSNNSDISVLLERKLWSWKLQLFHFKSNDIFSTSTYVIHIILNTSKVRVTILCLHFLQNLFTKRWQASKFVLPQNYHLNLFLLPTHIYMYMYLENRCKQGLGL